VRLEAGVDRQTNEHTVTFSDLTVLDDHQEEHASCKN